MDRIKAHVLIEVLNVIGEGRGRLKNVIQKTNVASVITDKVVSYQL